MEILNENPYCEICQGAERELLSIFETFINFEDSLIAINEIIQQVLEVKVSTDNISSKFICFNCKEFVLKFFNFKLKLNSNIYVSSGSGAGLDDISKQIIGILRDYMNKTKTTSIRIEEIDGKLIISSDSSDSLETLLCVDKQECGEISNVEHQPSSPSQDPNDFIEHSFSPEPDSIVGETNEVPEETSPIKVQEDTSPIEIQEAASSSTNYIECEFCNESFTDIKIHYFRCKDRAVVLRENSKAAKKQEFITCEYCQQVFSRKTHSEIEQFRGHKTRCKQKNYPQSIQNICQHCRFGFKDPQSLQTHQKFCQNRITELESASQKIDSNTCGVCNKKFGPSQQHLIKNHKDMHISYNYLKEKGIFKEIETLERTKVCPKCSQSFDNFEDAQEHFVFKHMKSFVCPAEFCQIEKKSFNVFYYHIQKSHPGYIPMINSFPCDYCSVEFESYSQLDLHRKRGSCDGKKFVCDHCGKRFGVKRELQSHLHKVYNPIYCYICSKVCEDGTKFKEHMRSHTREKPFQCRICNKFFTSSGNLTAHTKNHVTEKNFKCKFCRYTTTTKKKLSIHLRYHLEKVECPVCQKMFSKKFAVQIHIKTVHQITDPHQLKILLDTIKPFSHFSETLKRQNT